MKAFLKLSEGEFKWFVEDDTGKESPLQLSRSDLSVEDKFRELIAFLGREDVEKCEK